jgi:hypothetical protein
MSAKIPHASDVAKVVSRCKMGQVLVYDKIMEECVASVLSAARRGKFCTVYAIPCFKAGYPAYNVDELRYWVLHQLLVKKYCVYPYKGNLLYIQWSPDNKKQSATQ